MGGIILGKSTSDESEKLSLAIYALSEVATKKIKSGIILLEDDLDIFCNSILSRDEDAQIKLINNLCNEILLYKSLEKNLSFVSASFIQNFIKAFNWSKLKNDV